MENSGLIKSIIKDVLLARGLKTEKILLFGSRARGDNDRLSDYDILVIINQTLSVPEKMEISSLIRKKSAEKKIDADVIIKSAKETETSAKQFGTVTRDVLREGVPL
ncbi:MAG: nucleotidyltransferase domain-containing protein [Candidatus Goldiibacteriota bacterium]